MADRRRHITLPPPPEEQRPLLSRLYTDHGDDGDNVYSCMSNPHSHLPVYTTIHRIRRDIISVVEDYLSLEQLRDVRINVTVVRPLVDKFFELDDISVGPSSDRSRYSSSVQADPRPFSLLLAGEPRSVPV